MDRGKKIGLTFGIVGVLTLGGVVALIAGAQAAPSPATVMEGSEELPNDGVIKIPAGDQGYYVWDSRTELCFFIHPHRYGHAIVGVPCESVTRATSTE